MKNLNKLALLAATAIVGFGANAAMADMDADTSTQSSVETSADAEMDFSSVDTNEDGQISETEFENSVEADTASSSFTELDTDGNGSLNESEFDVIAEVDTKLNTTTTSTTY